MIRLKNLLSEISLARMEAPTIVRSRLKTWHVMMSMSEFGPSPEHFMWDSPEWQFGFFVESETRGWTTSTELSGQKGKINMLRFFKTIGLAIAQFAETHENIDVIDITGGDTSSAKAAQKDRIYANLIESNPELSMFHVGYYRTQLYLVRRAPRPDASGIDTPNDPTM